MFRLATRASVLVILIVVAQAWVGAQKAQPARADAAATAAPVNLNTASAEQLQTLQGVGAKMAARIIEYRQKNGPFKKIEDLMNVRGIGEKNFLKIRNRITVTPAKPAAPNGQ